MSRQRTLGSVLSIAIVSVASPARATVTEVGPGDNVEAAMNALQPGDELVLRGGDYTLTDAWHVTMMGTAQAPIIVRAKDGEHPHLDRPAVDQNIIDFDQVAYVELLGIEFSGGSAGLRLIDVNHMTIRDCEVHRTDDVAIAANSGTDYTDLKVIHNHLHDTGNTGEGMYIGCNNNGCRVHDSLFEGNYIHNTNGPTVTQGDGIEIKEGSYNNVVRDNVIHDTGYPCIITYSTVGNGGPNIIERNVMWGCGDHAIQSAADVIIRNNIILGSAAYGIANQPHQAGTPSNIQILHNTILHPTNDAIASTGITGSVVIANNAVYAQNGNAIRVSGDLTGVTVAGNVGVGGLSGVAAGLAQGNITADFVAASFSGMLPNDVFPKPGSALIAAGDTQYVVADDFNGTLRNGVADVGAYLYAASGNSGWPIAGAFKNATPPPPGSGGASGSGGSAGAGGAAGGTTGSGGSATAGAGGAAGGTAGGGGSATAGAAGTSGTAGTMGTSGTAGAGGEPQGANGGGGPTADGGPGAAGASSGDSGGCGCRTATGDAKRASAWLLALGAVVAGLRRRARRVRGR